MAGSAPWMNPARLWFCVFLLLAVAVVAAQAHPVSQARSASIDRSIVTTRGPLFRYLADVAGKLGTVSLAAIGGTATD